MKLRELLKEDVSKEEIEAWFEDWTQGADEKYDGQLEDGQLVMTGWPMCEVWSIEPNKKFDPPMSTSWWPDLNAFSVFTKEDHPTASIIIPDFHKMPNAKTIHVRGVKIKSLKGIENMSKLENFEFGFGLSDFECGVLSFLKVPNLKRIIIADDSELPDDKIGALKIARKHLADKDISECMDELIEAGFKEYAKL